MPLTLEEQINKMSLEEIKENILPIKKNIVKLLRDREIGKNRKAISKSLKDLKSI